MWEHGGDTDVVEADDGDVMLVLSDDPMLDVEWVTAVLASAASTTVEPLTDEELSARVVALEAARPLLDAACAHAAAELDARNVPDETHGMRTGAWIATETRTPHGKAKRRVHVARRLRDEFPELDVALSEGRVSWWHCDTFCHAANPRIAPAMGLLLPELIRMAEWAPFGPWCRELRRCARRLDVDGGHDPDHDQTESRLFLSRTLGSTRELSGRLVGVLGASFEEMLDAETDRQYRLHQDLAKQTSGETDIPSRPQLRALALVELCRKGTGHTGAATAADLTIVHHDEQAGTPRTPVDDLVARCLDEYETTYGDLFTSHQLACHLCDPLVRHLIDHGHGAGSERLDLGREERFANRAQRRAAHRRDGGCVFPGCDVPARHTDLHHVWWWEHGGPTDLANLASLCRFHHGVTHRRGWTMHANGDGTFHWTTPSGRTLHSQQHGLPTQRAGP